MKDLVCIFRELAEFGLFEGWWSDDVIALAVVVL